MGVNFFRNVKIDMIRFISIFRQGFQILVIDVDLRNLPDYSPVRRKTSKLLRLIKKNQWVSRRSEIKTFDLSE